MIRYSAKSAFAVKVTPKGKKLFSSSLMNGSLQGLANLKKDVEYLF